MNHAQDSIHIRLLGFKIVLCYLEVSSYIECDCSCGVNDIEDGEVETEGQHTRTEMMMRADHGEGCDSNQLRIPLPSSSSAGIPTIMVEKGAM